MDKSRWLEARARIIQEINQRTAHETFKIFFGDTMQKGKLFQYAILFHPTEEEYKTGKRSEVIVPVKTILSADEKSAAMTAAREIPVTYEQRLEQIEIAIQPF